MRSTDVTGPSINNENQTLCLAWVFIEGTVWLQESHSVLFVLLIIIRKRKYVSLNHRLAHQYTSQNL